MIDGAIAGQLDKLNQKYAEAQPFPHVVVDNFFATDFAEGLLADFPPFAAGNATNEVGKQGKKSVNPDFDSMGKTYRELGKLIVSPEFIAAIEKITGIEDLVALPGGAGGTHESRTGADLSPHIDYNYIDYKGHVLHRRLNVLFYLNKDWQQEWGGNFEVHSNPRKPSENTFFSYQPDFNRCIIMETSERSWHGYDPIRLPESSDNSRKSISIYLFSATRPEEEIAPRHSTFYVQRPLAPKFREGHTLSEQDMRELQGHIIRRDHWITFYQNEVLRFSAMNTHQATSPPQINPASRLAGRIRYLLRRLFGRA